MLKLMLITVMFFTFQSQMWKIWWRLQHC